MKYCMLIILFFTCMWPGRIFQLSNSTNPVKISPVVISGEQGACPADSTYQAHINATKHEIRQAIDDEFSHSCQGTGWRRVAFLNMTQADQRCPSALTYISSPVRGCGRTQQGGSTCDSVIFTIPVTSYTKVCGTIQAIQRGYTDAFRSAVGYGRNNIEYSYVDGLSLTYGPAGSRNHIWTFAAAYSEIQPPFSETWICACTNTRSSWPHTRPSFIGDNYFCDTGSSVNTDRNDYFPSDPLWDGEGCGPHSTCCQLNNPPWFQTTLPNSTTEDIELRLCNDGGYSNSDVILYFMEIYVQ